MAKVIAMLHFGGPLGIRPRIGTAGSLILLRPRTSPSLIGKQIGALLRVGRTSLRLAEDLLVDLIGSLALESTANLVTDPTADGTTDGAAYDGT